MTDDGERKGGRRKDGEPFKSGNTSDDGSYAVGKNRPPEHTRFAKGDNRPRGRRPKGTRNLQTDWSEELGEKLVVTENGSRKTITKQRGIVKAVAARAMKGSDRASEIAMRYAASHDERAGQLRISDKEMMERWAAQHFGQRDEPKLLDDADRQVAEGDGADGDPGSDGEGEPDGDDL